jgi:hypothetical protein
VGPLGPPGRLRNISPPTGNRSPDRPVRSDHFSLAVMGHQIASTVNFVSKLYLSAHSVTTVKVQFMLHSCVLPGENFS